jgi:hypothetical protein
MMLTPCRGAAEGPRTAMERQVKAFVAWLKGGALELFQALED